MQDDTQHDLALWDGLIDDYVSGAAWSPDGRTVYVASAAGWLYGFNSDTGIEHFRTQAHPAGLNALSVSPADGRILTAGKDGRARLWHPRTGALLTELAAGAIWVEHAAFSPNGGYFLTGAGKTLILWRADGREYRRYTDFESTISAIYWRDANQYAVACYGAIQLFQVGSETPFERLIWKTPMISLTWGVDGHYILAGTQDARIQVWKSPFVPGEELEMNGYQAKVKELSWCVGRQWLATNCGQQVVIWDMAGKGPENQQPIVLGNHAGKVSKLAFQHREEVLASGDSTGLVLMRHPNYPTLALEAQADAGITQLVWSPDDERLLVGTENGQVVVWQSSF